MADHTVHIRVVGSDKSYAPARVPTGSLLSDAARSAGVEIAQPCGGQGRCGRCMVQVANGKGAGATGDGVRATESGGTTAGGGPTISGVRRRSTLRLSAQDVERGYALACQSVVEGDVFIEVPPQEKIERRLSTDRTAAKVTVPPGYEALHDQSTRRLALTLPQPNMDDQAADWSRLQGALLQALGVENGGAGQVEISLPLLRNIGRVLRDGEWQATAIIDVDSSRDQRATGNRVRTTGNGAVRSVRLIDLQPGHIDGEKPLWGAAIDVGTTTVTVWLVDLHTGEVHAQAANYNGQIARGEDIISRIIYASRSKESGQEMRSLVLETINQLLERACSRASTKDSPVEPVHIVKATVAGNSTMMHLLLGIPAESIRLMPFVTAVNDTPMLRGQEAGLAIHAEATVDCLPGVASYVGADISAGVLSSGMDDTGQVSLFLDIGTNGETVLGSDEWLVTCACSAGPAFEGAGVLHGMRATRGAIEEVWVNGETYEPTYRVIGNTKPRGLCGSGLISLLAELFLTGTLDKGGHFKSDTPSERVRQGEHGLEYVIVWGEESHYGRDIVITTVDVDNLLRAKAAIYAGFTVLADSVGYPLEEVEQVLIGGAFGKYINVEKAVEIGLLPDMDWDRFQFLGNTAIRGAYLALLDREARRRIRNIAGRMTYIELSADNAFYDAFTSALFLPHTDLRRFPSVVREIERQGSPDSVGIDPEAEREVSDDA